MAGVRADTPCLVTPGDREGSYVLTPVAEDQVLRAGIDNNVTAFLADDNPLEKQTLMEAIGLGTWETKGPLMAVAGLTFISKEWYVLNEETFVMMCLSSAGWLAYVLAREPFGEWYAGGKAEILSAQNDAEDAHIAACRTFLESGAGAESMAGNVQSAFADRMALVGLEAKAKAVKERTSVKNDVERRLVQLVNMKNAADNEKYHLLLADAKAFVYSESQAPEFKKAAMAYAIQGLKDPKKLGDEPAAKLYNKFLAKMGLKK